MFQSHAGLPAGELGRPSGIGPQVPEGARTGGQRADLRTPRSAHQLVDAGHHLAYGRGDARAQVQALPPDPGRGGSHQESFHHVVNVDEVAPLLPRRGGEVTPLQGCLQRSGHQGGRPLARPVGVEGPHDHQGEPVSPMVDPGKSPGSHLGGRVDVGRVQPLDAAPLPVLVGSAGQDHPAHVFPRRLEPAQGPQQVKGSPQVHRQRQVLVHPGLGGAHRRQVEDETGPRRFHRPGHGLAILDLPPMDAQGRPGQRFGGVVRPEEEGHLSPQGDQPLGQRPTDEAGCAGDQDRLVP